MEILRGLRSRFEEHHEVRYTAPALRTAVEMSARYLGDRKLPDTAIDVIDEAGARTRLAPVHRRKKTVGVKEIEKNGGRYCPHSSQTCLFFGCAGTEKTWNVI